jgi:A/G-specific adenine glycosylase
MPVMKILKNFPVKKFRRALLAWYQREKRVMPWRNTKDPYKIWVSEIMLQQTQVKTVIPYYKKWIAAFPDVRALASAPPGKVLKCWEGLGYYRRAGMLHRAAKSVVKDLDCKIPARAALLKELPGIGRYTAGAIASIAFDEKVPVVDGNVVRILTRLFALRQSIELSAAISALWDLAGALLEERAPGDFNQAMMELGATVCSPQNPECGRCPARTFCKAHRLKREMFFPVRTRKENYESVTMHALVLSLPDGRVLLQRQPAGYWWTGLWTFPFFNSFREMAGICGEKGVRPLGKLCHSVTRYRIELRVWTKNSSRKNLLHVAGSRWVPLKNLKKTALPAPHRKIANLLLEARK